MIIDSHVHVVLPLSELLNSMDRSGIDRTILFPTVVHPEKASDLLSLNQELQVLNGILSGQVSSMELYEKAMMELMEAISLYPAKFYGFGRVPLGVSPEEMGELVQQKIVANGLKGMGEFAPASGQTDALQPIFAASAEFGNLPIWIHSFFPLGLSDIKNIDALSRCFNGVPVIMGHMGGTHWAEVIELALGNPNLYLDLSAMFTIMAPRMAIKELPERVLFGSDAPYGDPCLVRQMVEQITPDKTLRDLVLGQNIARLLGLDV